LFGKAWGLLSTKSGGAVVVDGGAEHVGNRYEKHVTSWAHTPGYDYGPAGSRITQLKKALFALPLEDYKPDPSRQWHTEMADRNVRLTQ